jgi:hypothetical protein
MKRSSPCHNTEGTIAHTRQGDQVPQIILWSNVQQWRTFYNKLRVKPSASTTSFHFTNMVFLPVKLCKELNVEHPVGTCLRASFLRMAVSCKHYNVLRSTSRPLLWSHKLPELSSHLLRLVNTFSSGLVTEIRTITITFQCRRYRAESS